MADVDHEGLPEPDPLTRLRAAATAVAELDGPASPAADPGATDPSGQHGAGEQAGPEAAGLDVAAHADRFSELHDALVAVLADVDQG